MTERQLGRGVRTSGRRWESVALGVLAYPANLAFAGLAAFMLALPVVTWLVAAIAAGRALARWSIHDDDRVFTNTFREFRAVWRRALPLSVAATAIVVVIITNLLFLGEQNSPAAYLFGMATMPVAVAFVVIVVFLPSATLIDPHGTSSSWLRATAGLATRHPLASLAVAAISIGVVLTCVLLPTIAPFFGLSLPAWLGFTAVRPLHPQGDDQL